MFQIEKLDSNNYESWCLQMKSILIQAEFWKVTNGELLKPQKAKELEQWQVNHVKNCSTSFQAWCKLKDIFIPSGPARKVTLFKHVMQFKIEDDDNVPQFLDKKADRNKCCNCRRISCDYFIVQFAEVF